MVLQEIGGGGGYDDVQDTNPSNPSIGDTWLDTSDGDATGKIYADLGNGADWQVLPVQDELQNGRTRELLLLLQDKPVPEVQDPMNLQSGLSVRYKQVNTDYELGKRNTDTGNVTDRPLDEDTILNTTPRTGVLINANKELAGVKGELSRNTSGATTAYLMDSGFNTVRASDTISGGSFELIYPIDSISDVGIVVDADGSDYDMGRTFDVFPPYTGADLDILSGVFDGGTGDKMRSVNNLEGITESEALSGYVTDNLAAPTTEPADFKAWNAIQARDVTTGGSTSPEPVEFEILDSTDTALNSTRIPKARIADEPFTMRNRVYSEDAGTNGQGDYQIATTGDGGHFGIPILTAVSVKKNGSVLDSANWSFDGTDTVTIDTSNVTIASGDTIEIKYDFDVFDSTLQPRAYLSRESASEASPSISHFRYEYII